MDLGDAKELSRALGALMQEAHTVLAEAKGTPELVARVTGHLGCDLKNVVSITESFAAWEHANLQRGVDAYLARHSPQAEWFGISGQGREHNDYVNMLAGSARGFEWFEIGAVDYATAAVGPDETMEVIALGLVLTRSPGGSPVVVGLRGPQEHGAPQAEVTVLAAERRDAVAVRDEIGRLMREHDVYRGQVLSFAWSEHRGNDLVSFLPRPAVSADQVVLPEGVLDTVERHIVGIGELAARLREHGQHLKRGLLLHGPPGTGKTHTVRYLMGRLAGSTVIVMTGSAIRFVSEAAGLARRLQPALVILEDVDLVAMDRSFHPEGNPLLFALLDAMDGVGADSDVTFVLTTNRAGVLERALADRPGRVDLAVEIPKPDAAGRAALLRLYARDLRLEADLGPVVAKTEGATASFFKELLRRAVLIALRGNAAGTGNAVSTLTDAHLGTALEEMLGERETLTRALLGSGEHDADEDPPVTVSGEAYPGDHGGEGFTMFIGRDR
ncbi:ATP-binding protein [Planomonospora sp. ID67723]|uniref:AAA family ATPase n=1 Tax=Planomonospora sp. ID67723 TaxID=2738134 RepID=UPI0018C35B28|nr:AAA family ATPase [Planomonospora sp. ID67723]MBG0829698.1 ATP-binding protein [Planomonospora sp. ID67723]